MIQTFFSKALILRMHNGCLWPDLVACARVDAMQFKTWVTAKKATVQDVEENQILQLWLDILDVSSVHMNGLTQNTPKIKTK